MPSPEQSSEEDSDSGNERDDEGDGESLGGKGDREEEGLGSDDEASDRLASRSTLPYDALTLDFGPELAPKRIKLTNFPYRYNREPNLVRSTEYRWCLSQCSYAAGASEWRRAGRRGVVNVWQVEEGL